MLVSGPPGLGKTTLVHIAARHAGYRPSEINASDERSAKVLKQRVSEATEVQSVYGDRRPPLIIIDEIDGAMGGAEGTGAVNELIRLANATTAAADGASGAGVSGAGARDSPAGGPHAAKKGKRGGGSKSPSGGLMRPVICICNDIHAPALRPLRAVAELVEFRSASNAQLVARLKAVCKAEKMHADNHALSALASLSGHDVRTCLNALQFVRAKSASFTEATLHQSGVGNKTVAKSPLQLWKQVFTAAPRAHRRGAAPAPRRQAPSGRAPPRAAARRAASPRRRMRSSPT